MGRRFVFMPHSQTPDWPRSWTQQVGREIARIRRESGLSQSELAARCDDFGVPKLRNAIVGLETGRRDGVTVHELVVIARALGVAPAELLFPRAIDGPQDDPDEDEPAVEYLPGMSMPSSAAWKNFHGRTSPASVRLVQAWRNAKHTSELLDGLVQEQREDEQRRFGARRDG